MIDLEAVELRHLMALQAVAAERSFGRAAERLGYTQSAVSQQIASLERILGGAVFERPGGPKPVEITPLGALLLEHATAILNRLDVAAAEIQLLRAGRMGSITIGTFQSVSVRLLPQVFQALAAERPDLEIRLRELDEQDALMAALQDRTLDAAFLVEPISRQMFDVVRVFEDPFVLLSPVGQDLAARNRVSVPVSRLAGVPLISQFDASHIRLVDGAIRRAGVDPNVVFRSSDNAAVQAMVRAGLGHAVMPSLAVDPADPDVLVRRLEPGIPSRVVVAATLRGRVLPPALNRFLELTDEAANRLVGEVDPVTGLTR
jgi:DNA-binding transcriptional LysR family regulator